RIDGSVARLEHVNRGHDVVHFSAAVVDRVEEALTVADAAAVLRSDDDVAFRGGLADVGNVVFVEVAADILVDPDQRWMSLRAAQLERLKDESRDLHVAGAAAVGDLLHLHEAGTRSAPRLVGLGLLLEHPLEVGLTLRRRRFLAAERDRAETKADRERGDARG